MGENPWPAATVTTSMMQQASFSLKVTSRYIPPPYPPYLGGKPKNFNMGGGDAPVLFPSRSRHLETVGLVVELGIRWLVASSGCFISGVAVH
jgi:hypothetical protein